MKVFQYSAIKAVDSKVKHVAINPPHILMLYENILENQGQANPAMKFVSIIGIGNKLLTSNGLLVIDVN